VAIHSAEALILEVFDLQEKDRIVTFLTRERGKVRGVARGARRKYSRFAGELQPLARVKVTWFEKEGRELVRISGVEPVQLAGHLLADLEGILLASYLAEHMKELAQENEPADLYFRLLESTVAALADGVDPDLATRFYETWMLRLAGVFPEPRDCPLCGRPLADGAVVPASGEGLVCGECGGGGFAPGALSVEPPAVEALVRFSHERLPALAARPPAPEVLRRVEEVAGRVRRAFLQGELKSYDVMRRTLASVAGAGGAEPAKR